MTDHQHLAYQWASNPLNDYLVDAGQRSVLYWDAMRQRGNQYHRHMARRVPNVLNYQFDVIVDGRTLAEPINYGLVKIQPPEGLVPDERKRPFVVVDPRAGHGPGIGGFKADSEIGVIMAAGHPCYFIGFTPHPEAGQTIEAVMRGEAVFLQRVIDLHPRADGKPVLIGNCQAGWAVMMLAAACPDLCGPIIAAGAPLSYWAGVRGQNPMRYTGGMLAGSWLTALVSDLGNGKFDGAWLVQNFELLNPANTLWTKQYNLYAKVDSEVPRYLGFERWWGGHVILSGDEIQYIVDNLFVGNKLSAAEILTSDGMRFDLRNIRAPIICFCSKGDNITPPQQALGWILDLYDSVDDIRTSGQTIIYAVHEHIGHLGIFVSGGVARKEHYEFASNIDFIDCMPPGLYEAVIEKTSAETVHPDLVTGDYISRFRTPHARRHPGPGGQQQRGRALFCHRGPPVGGHPRHVPDLRSAAGAGHLHGAKRRMAAPQPPAACGLRTVFRPQPDDADAAAHGRLGQGEPGRGGADQPLLAVADPFFRPDHSEPGSLPRVAGHAD